MGHSEAGASPGAEISAGTIQGVLDLRRKSETAADVEIATKTEEQHPPEERNGGGNSEPRSKKSLSFKLAFVGLAASLFVFQVDATCLGIALPVSRSTLPDLYATHVGS